MFFFLSSPWISFFSWFSLSLSLFYVFVFLGNNAIAFIFSIEVLFRCISTKQRTKYARGMHVIPHISHFKTKEEKNTPFRPSSSSFTFYSLCVPLTLFSSLCLFISWHKIECRVFVCGNFFLSCSIFRSTNAQNRMNHFSMHDVILRKWTRRDLTLLLDVYCVCIWIFIHL